MCQRCQCPRRDDLCLNGFGDLDALDHEPRKLLQTHLAACLPEEGRFPGIGFDEGDFEVGTHRGDNEPGKATSATEIGEGFGVGRDLTNDLGGVQDVALPCALQSVLSYEVDGFLPSLQSLDESFQPSPCFT